MLNQLLLGRIAANTTLEEKAAQIGRTFSSTVARFPSAHTQLMIALDFALGPSYEIVLAGNPQEKDTLALLKALRAEFIPNKVVLLRPISLEPPDITKIAPFTENMTSTEGKATAYVCSNYTCKFPTTNTNKMLDLIYNNK